MTICHCWSLAPWSGAPSGTSRARPGHPVDDPLAEVVQELSTIVQEEHLVGNGFHRIPAR